MKGLQLLRDAVIDALEKGGMTAIPAYPGKAKEYPGTVVTVVQVSGVKLIVGDDISLTADFFQPASQFLPPGFFSLLIQYLGDDALAFPGQNGQAGGAHIQWKRPVILRRKTNGMAGGHAVYTYALQAGANG